MRRRFETMPPELVRDQLGDSAKLPPSDATYGERTTRCIDLAQADFAGLMQRPPNVFAEVSEAVNPVNVGAIVDGDRDGGVHAVPSG
jgi:hypothetical protein